MRSISCGVGGIAITLSLAGCAGDAGGAVVEVQPGDPASTLVYAQSQGWDDVVLMLEDGEVTAEENAAAHTLWRECREAVGFTFGPTILDPINGKLYLETEEFRGDTDTDGSANDECYSRYSDTVELVYQSTAPSKMEPLLLTAVQQCLDAAGYERPLDGTETRLRDFYPAGEMWKPGDPVNTCVEDNYWDLYPGIAGLAYGFTLAD